MKCPYCGMEQSDGVAFCNHCGAALGQIQPGTPAPSMPTDGTSTPGPVPTPPHPEPPVVAGAPVCPFCSVQTVPGAAFCDNCGRPLGQPQSSVMPSIPFAPVPPEPVAVPASAPLESETDQGVLQTDVTGIQKIIHCPSCGKEVQPGMKFCDNCGANLTESVTMGSSIQTQSGSQPEGSLICAQCGAVLEPDSNFCDNCGAPVQKVPQTYASHQPLYTSQPASAHTQIMPPELWGTSPQQVAAPSYTPAIPARLVVQSTQIPLPFPAGKTEWSVGRADPLEGVYPDIDLTDHGGDELGVSRHHARIYMQGNQFYVVDLQSTNHTFVNQQRLLPNVPQVLSHGDAVRFGQAKLNFYLA